MTFIMYFLLLIISILFEISAHGQSPTSGQTLKVEVFRDTLRYDYERVLDLSLLFFEAQRSGRLPADNRIPWRNDSCLQCMGSRGENLQGGYYTSGRALKFTFPNAAATTVLAWSIITRKSTYYNAGLLLRAKEALKWGADYLVQCNTEEEIVALVGNVNDVRFITESSWTRPEDLVKPMLFYTINSHKPGADLSGEMAAALAASSIVFKYSNKNDSALYLEHAKKLFDFADRYQAKYSDSVKEVDDFYKSWYGYEDELIWSALWLHIATKEQKYFEYAEAKYNKLEFHKRSYDEFSWDDKTNGVKVLLYAITKSDKYLADARVFCDDAANPARWTKKGLYDRFKNTGNLRFASNAAFLCFQLGEQIKQNIKGENNPYINFLLKQVNYALGDTGRSFVVGFGFNWPRKIRHVGSSCRAPPAPCSYEDFDSSSDNPILLYGALVGGPDGNDHYEDTRDNGEQNDIGIDYNAGFQSAVASLLYLHEEGRLPKFAYACKFQYKTNNNINLSFS